MIAGINGVQGIHDVLYDLLGYINTGFIGRIVYAIQILCIYWIDRWSFTYMCGKEYSLDETGVGIYEHPKYDSFTRVNGLFMLTVFIITAIWQASTLQW